jgi:hypothetical protein
MIGLNQSQRLLEVYKANKFIMLYISYLNLFKINSLYLQPNL